MKFCSNCNNMYYIKISANDEDRLIYYCRNCGNEDNTQVEEDMCVAETNIREDEQSFQHVITKYTKYDPTLPRVKHIQCPNKECICNIENSSVEPEVIYIRYHEQDLKYVYLCVHCDTSWKSGAHTTSDV